MHGTGLATIALSSEFDLEVETMFLSWANMVTLNQGVNRGVGCRWDFTHHWVEGGEKEPL